MLNFLYGLLTTRLRFQVRQQKQIIKQLKDNNSNLTRILSVLTRDKSKKDVDHSSKESCFKSPLLNTGLDLEFFKEFKMDLFKNNKNFYHKKA